MPNYFDLVLDTTAPASPLISIEAGATYATAQLVNVAISTSDTPTTGYQMKLWGDVDAAYDANVQPLEASSAWITYDTSKQVKLSAVDGSKTVYMKIRDDVYNVSAQASDSILLDITLPIVTVAGIDVTRISKQSGKDTATFTFRSDSAFTQYKVKVVEATGTGNTTGVLIPTTNGSTNTSGTGTYPADTPITCTLNGTDLEVASSGDGTKIIKVFVQETSGNWSV